jgi:flagellar biosynthesis/type III secretory pathway chaperone
MINLQPLLQILHQERRVHEKILLAKRREQAFLATANVSELLKSSESLHDLVEEAQQLEEQRQQLTTLLAQQLHIHQEQPSLTDLLAAVPAVNRTELEQAGQDLRDLVQNIRHLNQINQMVLQRSLETMSQELMQIIQMQDSGVYTVKGRKSFNGIPRAGLNVKA